ncbi:MAG: N-acetyltransferase [Betaproteobacteria bacterium]|nr:MAG: N-acetyltransferase [Betaproteobacteria bacterium]
MRTFIQLSDAKAAAQYRSMTFPAFQGLLNFNSADVAPLAVGTLQNEAPAGLALLVTSPNTGEAELLSIFVAPRLRRNGIALELMQRTLAYCKTQNIQKISASYMSGQDSTQTLENIFNKTGWTAPQTRMLVVRCSLDSIKSAPWLNRYALPKGYEVLPWAQVTTAEREALRVSNLEKPWIAPDLVPFDFEENYEPVTSVALRVNGAIVGWCLTHAVEGMLRFTCAFVRKDLQRLGRLLLLWDEVVARMPHAGCTVGMWTIRLSSKSMVDFARKHMQPYSIYFGETRGVTIQMAFPEGIAGQ